MYHIAVGFYPIKSSESIDAHHVTARGLNGLLFHVIKNSNPYGAEWLHNQPSPKPYSMTPYYTNNGSLAGIRYGALTEETAEILYQGWERSKINQETLKLGHNQHFYTHTVEAIPFANFVDLVDIQPSHDLSLNFVSPTAFKQGDDFLRFPLPGNVFRRPLQVWQAFAPKSIPQADKWHDWCTKRVYVTDHQIQTASISMRPNLTYTGFVGQVQFKAKRGSKEYLRVFQALGTLAQFCGVGSKTTMGMGAVQRL